MSSNTTNGDPSFASMGSPLLDFFAGVCRKDKKLDSAMEARIPVLMSECWAEDPLLTLKLLFYKRDCREGAGERRIFEIGFAWVVANHPAAALVNMKHIPEYGSWKDVQKLLSSAVGAEAVDMFARALTADNETLIATNATPVSLAAKWAPSLGGAADVASDGPRQIARSMSLGAKWQRVYRHMLRNLRDHITVVESLMSAGRWDAIDFGRVPSLAMQRYRTAFERHTPERWITYLAQLKTGEAKVNSKQLMPHEILSHSHLQDPLTEHQWAAMVADVRRQGTLEHAVAMCDVSGSMAGLPMDVSVALGILVSEVSVSARGHVLTFSNNPRFFKLDGLSLADKVHALTSEVGFNTNLRAAFDHMLMQVDSHPMPDKLIIISDMQFDSAMSEPFGQSTYEDVKRRYAERGCTMPQVVFWNVQGLASSFPVNDATRGVCMVSGFSQNILKSVLGDITDPRSVMVQTLNSERYARITL